MPGGPRREQLPDDQSGDQAEQQGIVQSDRELQDRTDDQGEDRDRDPAGGVEASEHRCRDVGRGGELPGTHRPCGRRGAGRKCTPCSSRVSSTAKALRLRRNSRTSRLGIAKLSPCIPR